MGGVNVELVGMGDHFGLQIIWLELLPLRDILLPAPTLSELGEYHFEYAGEWYL